MQSNLYDMNNNMSRDAGGLSQMTYNNNNNNGFSSAAPGAPGTGFGNRSRLGNKRLSVALPPKVNPIHEGQVDNPTPRTSRSHLLAGLRTQPKAPMTPASAPYHQAEHAASSRWAQSSYDNAHMQGVPQTATAAVFGFGNQYAISAGKQTYALPEQVLAPPSMYDHMDDVDPAVLQQMQMTSLYLAQRKEQLQQQLATLTAATQGLNLNTNMQYHGYTQSPITPQTPQNYHQQHQIMQPMEVQPGVYLVYNPAIQGYSYVMDNNLQQAQSSQSPAHQHQASAFSPPSVQVSPPATERSTPTNTRSFSPPKKAPSPPSTLEHVEPLPPPSANAFRRGHKKVSSLAINPLVNVGEGPKTSSAATFATQRSAYPSTPATGTFGPGNARAGDHPVRQPRGPPPLEELVAAPTSKHEGSKNFATRQRRRALDNLMKAGIGRRAVSRSSGGTPVSERDFDFSTSEDFELASTGSAGSRKMSPIGSEMQKKRGSQGSTDGYFGLCSASSSEGEDAASKQPSTPATPVSGIVGGERKKMTLGVLAAAAEKRKSFAF